MGWLTGPQRLWRGVLIGLERVEPVHPQGSCWWETKTVRIFVSSQEVEKEAGFLGNLPPLYYGPSHCLPTSQSGRGERERDEGGRGAVAEVWKDKATQSGRRA